MKKYLKLFIPFQLTFLLLCIPFPNHADKSILENNENYRVIKIISNRSLVAKRNDQKTKIYLIGIKWSGDKSGIQYLEKTLLGKEIYLEKEKTKDSDQGLQVYVFRYEDDLFINCEIIRRGYGAFDKGNSRKYMAELKAAEKEAKLAKAGIWQ
ncbi:thermonuclease family protein, partial [bacterium]|nr:thermonuclease family protein [bacterium]